MFKVSHLSKHLKIVPEGHRLLFRLLGESLPVHKKKYSVAVVAMVFMAVTTAAMAWIMGQIVDVMSDPSRQGEIIAISIAIFLIFVLKGVASFVQITFLAKAGNRIVADKQIEVFNHLIRQSADYFGSTSSSELVMRVANSVKKARAVIDVIVTGFVRDLLTLIGLIALMFYQQPMLSLITFIIGPVILLVLRRILGKVRLIMEQELAGMGAIIKVVQETSTGMRVIKAFALEDRLSSRMVTAARKVERRSNKIKALEAATDPLVDTIAGFAISGVILIGAIGVLGDEAGTPGQLISFVTAFLLSYEPAKRLSKMRVTIESGMIGVRMMYEVLDRPIGLQDPKSPKPAPQKPIEVSLEEVSFGYTESTPTIDRIDHVFRAGKVTALVGPSGGGKSTILNLLLRLHDPTEGRICLNGVDVRDLKSVDLRRLISFVGQDTFLFDETIRENIRMVREDATDEEIMEAARIANAHEFIMKYKKGYDTLIGENGRNLSGGQRQRISIARAILKNAPVLLLDEATSALDSHSEKHVQEAIEVVTKGTTMIVVAHRLSTVLRADEICYVEDGKIVESGTLNELLEKNGKFLQLYETQFNVD